MVTKTDNQRCSAANTNRITDTSRSVLSAVKSRRHVLWHRGTKIIKLHSHIQEEKNIGRSAFLLYLVTKPVREFFIKKNPLLPSPCSGRLYRIKASVRREHPVAAAILRNTLYELKSFIRYYKYMPAVDSDPRLIHAFVYHCCLLS